MKFLNKVLQNCTRYNTLCGDIKKGYLPVLATGLSHIHKALICAAIIKESARKQIVITPDEASAVSLINDLKSLGVSAINFPVRDFCLNDMSGRSREYEHSRLDTLSKLLDGAFQVLCLSVEAACQLTVPPEILRDNIVTLSVGEECVLENLSDNLLNMGYTRTEQVEGTGQFSVRGGIIDIFATNEAAPVRIELWGDEIDTISYFDIASQRRNDSTDSIKIFPAAEVFYNAEQLADAIEEYLNTTGKLSDKRKIRLQNDAQLLRGGVGIVADRYISLIYRKATVFDYIDAPVIMLSDSSAIDDTLDAINTRWREDYKLLLDDGLISVGLDKFMLEKGELDVIAKHGVYLENFTRARQGVAFKDIINFNFKRLSPWQGDESVLLEDVQYLLSQKGDCVVLAGEEKAARVLYNSLTDKGLKVNLITGECDKLPRGLTVMCGGLSSGFELPDQKFMLLSHNYIRGEKRYKRLNKNENSIGSLDELHAGDYVVHASHGIGIFAGINKITGNGVTKDYIKINYAKTDVLYVPVTQLDLISKYVGAAENGSIKLNRLGSNDWQKTRARVKRAVKDMAKQLTALYAKRQSIKGYAFSPDTELQNEFESKFPYVETEDQIQSIREIKRDMEREVPMDRLLCGDVGFGKTEVALRAAFKCVSEGKQCAFLVPTTILAWQHYNTVLRRFGEMPLNVKMLSRFVTPSAQRQTIADLKNGKVDMVIGTHRLISNDVEFKNIGLVIIDEEQRFGVAQKERLKELYPAVDVLTLSATPIPRTLNMAMSGLRDMSSIDEAPGDRQPVQSYVLEYNEGLIIDAIRKELRRSGQVYYLHNRVESIVSCAAKLKERLPEARIEVAHGKMSEEQLSNVWRRLIEHETDILVCTTIIETGVDVPNVNTLIIEDADRMGLSQLHQLRGRVGRSPRRAYAFFTFRRGRQLTDIAEKRLEAIREYTEFGAGFKIAMRDLEIRGAGSILGGEQHGNMEAVGYDMYIRLLNDAINEEKGIKTVEENECTVDLNVSAYIPERYIESLPARLGIYKRIAAVKSDEQRLDVIDELCDRFGEPPKAVMGLIDIALLRNRAAAIGIYEINEDKNGVILRVNAVCEQQLDRLNSFGKRMYLSADEKPYYFIKAKQGQKFTELISEIATIL
ncbi:MAG: transcription-repair coupling factor [Ruminococcaceae bacterium]|nr:transcription-repair coupling factor [Oscillospiraceae bacterium]